MKRLASIRNRIVLGIGGVGLVLLAACDNPAAFDCIKTTGDMHTIRREMPPFRALLTEDNIDVYLTNDTSSVITIEAGKNLIDKVEYETTGDTLILRNKNSCNWARSYDNRIKVTVGIGAGRLQEITHYSFGKIQSLEKLRLTSMVLLVLEGNGNVTLDMQADNFYVYTNCSPAVVLTGEVGGFSVWSRSAGKIMAEGLVAQGCDIRNASANEIRVFPLKKLVATIEESGNILYYHTPEQIETHITGSGQLLRK